MRNFQTNGEGFSGGGSSLRFFFGQIAKWIAAVIDAFSRLRSGPLGNFLLDAFVVALFLGREIAVGLALCDQTARGHAMLFGIVRLKNDLFVVVQPEPLQ